MTSKEALEYLEKINSKQNNGNGDVWLEMIIDSLKKDLKVLEILKKYMWFSFQSGFQVVCNELIDLGNEEEYLKLKEWAENEKIH